VSASAPLGAALSRLGTTFGGRICQPTDADYDDARRVHNGLIDRRPAVITQCRDAQDVAAALEVARAHDLPVSVRGGGHNVAGNAVADGGLMVDLSPMRAVRVDPARRVAVAGGGALWGEFNRATQAHGLATTGGVISSTGVAGLTLGGGLGWLMARHGMAADNLVGAEMVTADGDVLSVSEDEHPDLFWAIRGGGGNFGVAASLSYRLHPVGPTVVGGLVAHPFERGAEMLHTYRALTAGADDDLSVFAGLLHAPDGSGAKIGAMVVFHPEPDAGLAAVAPVRAFGPPVMDTIGPMPYEAVNSMLDGGFPRGALNYWKSSFLTDLTDEVIAAMAEAFSACPAPMGAMLLEHFHGAVTRVGVTDTAYPHRQTGYNLVIIGEWMDPGQNAACVGWVRETFDALRPFMASGRYVNYLGNDEAQDAVAAAYGPNYARLRQVKRRYDPENVFRMNQNILPA
jgi:FAD/FMN-containing dehydrogenase